MTSSPALAPSAAALALLHKLSQHQRNVLLAVHDGAARGARPSRPTRQALITKGALGTGQNGFGTYTTQLGDEVINVLVARRALEMLNRAIEAGRITNSKEEVEAKIAELELRAGV